ncbi:MAG: ABC transporter ATP-binding protein [Ktedonobacterales bacterium]
MTMIHSTVARPTYYDTQQPLLEIRHLDVDYYAANGAVHAVSDVTLTLRRGHILGLAGESGSGKSTLAYAITRLLRSPAAITGGEILYYPNPARPRPHWTAPEHLTGEQPFDILELSPAQLRTFRWNEISIVFQSAMNALNPVLTIGAQIMDVLRTHAAGMRKAERRERAVELLRLVGIAPDRLNSYPHELSGGMRQRAIIAIALALSPELIIMDEPTTALDVVVQREILLEIMELRERLNLSIIFITHDLSLLLEIADEIAIMYAGRVVETAAGEDLQHHPRHPYSYGMLNSFPKLHGPHRAMMGIPGSPPDLRSLPPGCAFSPRCPMAFSPCWSELPPLRPPQSQTPELRVACHLHDPRHYSGEPPTQQEFAARYETAYAQARGEGAAQ